MTGAMGAGPTWDVMQSGLAQFSTPFLLGPHNPKEDPQPGDLKTWTDDHAGGMVYTHKVLSRVGDVLRVESADGRRTWEGLWSLRGAWLAPGPLWIWRAVGTGEDSGITLDVTGTGYYFRVSGDPADDVLSGSRPSLELAIGAARQWKKRLGGGL